MTLRSMAPLIALAPLLSGLSAPRAQAAEPQVQLQLSCSGTVIAVQGSSTLKRAIARLRLNLGLEAEGANAASALALLQERLDPVRLALQSLEVSDLRVSAPSVWSRYVPEGKPTVFEANTQVSGRLAPAQLQNLISQVGGLPGVRLAPVEAEPDKQADARVSRQLLQAAYGDALQRGQTLAATLGLRRLRPLQLQVDGGVRPEPMVALAMPRNAAAPLDPRELPEPSDTVSLSITFCASP